MKRQDDYSIDIPATEIAENSPQTEETSLQMEAGTARGTDRSLGLLATSPDPARGTALVVLFSGGAYSGAKTA